MVLGWGSQQRQMGQDPYANTNVGSSIGGFFANELLGLDDFRRAGAAWRQGDLGQLAKSVGTGLFELGTTAAIPFTGGGSVLARLVPSRAARTAINVGANAGPFAVATGGVLSGWQPAAQRRAQQEQRSMQAQAQRYQGLADQFQADRARRNVEAATNRWSQDPFLQFQPGMTSPFSAEGIQQAGQAVERANRFSQALGLTPEQTEYFQRMANQAELERDRLLGDLAGQEDQFRRQAIQAGRSTRARGAGSMADLQQAAAARGLMASPASFDVGRDTVAGQVAAEQAQQQAALADILGQVERARGQVTSDYRAALDELTRGRLASQLENEQNAIDRLLSGYFR